MKKMYNQSGITMTSLVITIIILVILAGVTINLTIGNEGIIKRAEEAGKNYQDAATYEKDSLADFIQQAESIINGGIINGSYSKEKKVNSPKIAGTGLTAVTINADGSLINANTSKEDWYSYDGTTNNWANAKTADGSLFVWIPRFAYKINSDNSIDVVFLKDTTNFDSNGNNVTSTKYVDEKGVTGAYTVHPAFKDGSKEGYPNGEWNKEIPGFWIAKFEAGYQDANIAKDSEVDYSTIMSFDGNTSSDVTTTYYGTRNAGTLIKYPVFQANKPSMNHIGISDAFDLCKNMTSSKAPYGLANSVKPHLTKNSEWGAVAYLTHSKYGRNNQEVMINNVSLNGENTVYAVTGYAAESITSDIVTTNLNSVQNGQIAGSWTTEQGKNASTTKNIYGIYDLSGGLWEWTAGYIASGDNYNQYAGSLKGENNEYKNKYAGTSSTDTENYSEEANSQRVGEAIWETSTNGTGNTSINGDYSAFVYSAEPVFARGGSWGYNTTAGTFAFARVYVYGNFCVGFRPVLIAE